MQTLLKQSIIGGLSFFLLTGIAFSVGSSEPSVFEGEAAVESIDSKNHQLVQTDFGNSSSNASFSITKTVSTSSFVYAGNYNFVIGTWVNLKVTGAFSKANESGSLNNKWYLTGIAISYSRYTSAVGNALTLDVKYPESTSANSTRIISTTGLTNSTSLTNLNNNRTSYSNLSLFTKTDNVTTFKLVPGAANFVIENITVYYSIDYSNC
jgi:hypothetical protein